MGDAARQDNFQQFELRVSKLRDVATWVSLG